MTVQKNAAVGLLDFSMFDAAKAWLDLSDSNILAKPLVAVSINLVLRRSGSIVGSASFPATQSGSMVRFNSPASVTTWLRSFGGQADELTGDVAGLGFTEKDGTNVVTVKLVYDGSVDTGVSQSWYRSDGGGSCAGCALN